MEWLYHLGVPESTRSRRSAENPSANTVPVHDAVHHGVLHAARRPAIRPVRGARMAR